MEGLVKSILEAIVDNNVSSFFKNIENIFHKAVLDGYQFAEKKEYREITKEYHPRGIIRSYIFAIIDRSEQLKDKVKKDGSVSRALITADAVKQWFLEDEEFYLSFFVQKMFKKGIEKKLLSREMKLVSYLWIHESGMYERKQ